MDFSVRRRTNSNKMKFVGCYQLPIYIYMLLSQYDCQLEDLPKCFITPYDVVGKKDKS